MDAYEAVLAAQGISITRVAKPTAVQDLVYDGTEQVGVEDGDGYSLQGTIAATDVGTYTATAVLDDPQTFVWSDNTTADKTITWSIAPAQLTATYEGGTIRVGEAAPTSIQVAGFVNGETVETAAGYVAPVVNTSGVNVQTPGKYDVGLSDGAATNYTFSYESNPVVVMGVATVPTVRTGLKYTGKTQTGVPAASTYTLSGESASGAGDHIATATLTPYFTWPDGSTDAKQIAWSIAPVTLTARYTGGRMYAGDQAPGQVEVTGFVNGETAATATGYVAPTVTLTQAQRTTAGTYSIVPAGGKADNYTFVYKPGVLEVSNTIVVNAPVATTGLVYNGSAQVGVGVKTGNAITTSSSAGYTITNAKATNAGTYTSVAHLADGYIWSDGTKGDKKFVWKIAPVQLTATYVGGTIWAGATAPKGITVTGFKGGQTAATARGYKAPTVTITNAQRSTPGVYTITPTGGSASNYTFKYVAGKLSVYGKVTPPSAKTLTYNGATQTGVTAGTGYTLSGITSAVGVGTYTAKATLKSQYKWNDGTTGVRTITWKINPLSLASATVSAIGDQAYTGGSLCPKPEVKAGGRTLSQGSDYTLTYRSNSGVGTATVTATGRGNYTGSKSATFRIVAPSVRYRTHVQTFGNQAWRYDGAMSGTSGKAKRLEGIWIELAKRPLSGGIQYRTHVQTYGWQTWRSNGAMSGTSGKAKRLEAICIRLTGEMAKKYDVYYRVHAQTFGWMGWAKNGAQAGTAGYGKRLEGIEVRIVPKGAAAPGTTWNAFRKR